MNVDLNLLERWLTGWSLARGLPLPRHHGGGLVVDVGWPEQLRRHVFLDAGRELRECASQIHDPFIYLKAAVDADQMRLALPAQWTMESPRYLMYRPTAMAGPVAPPAGYIAEVEVGHGAYVVRYADSTGQVAASGRVVLNRGSAVFDRIETLEPHRGKGLGTALMSALDALAEQAGVAERLLVATEAGRALYFGLGWQVLAPYSTAVLPGPPGSSRIAEKPLKR
jgi:GNAT superfamily N-acetyltransferase